MYNIWCEIKKMDIVIILLGLVLFIASFFNKMDRENITYAILIGLLTLLLIVSFIKKIVKYKKLKKNGKIIEKVPYHIENVEKSEKVLVADFKLPDGKIKKLMKGHEAFDNIKERGTTKVLMDTKNYKYYYIFNPKD